MMAEKVLGWWQVSRMNHAAFSVVVALLVVKVVGLGESFVCVDARVR
jgi:hypothetical protein